MTPRSRRWMAIALGGVVGTVVVLAVFVWAFDWNWVRPSIERHLTQASGRAVHLGDLRVALDRHLDVNVRLRGVDIANTAWADTREPMAVVGEARFAVSLQSLWERRPIVARLVLVDGRIDLQRQADGLRNWRLNNPDDRGPGTVVIRAIEAQRTRLRFVRRGIDLDVTATATPASPETDPALPTRISFTGRLAGEPFDGEADTGPELTIQDTGRSFPLHGRMNAAGSHLRADGRVTDFLRRAGLDGHVHVEGPSLARLRRFLRAPLPDSRPFVIDADLKKAQTEYTFAKVQARVGQTALVGDLAYDVRQGRPWIEATLRSEVAQWGDLQSLTTSGAERPATTSGAEGPATTPAPASADTRAHPLDLARLKRVDARLDVAVGRLVKAELPALGGLRFKATLADGRLALTDLRVGLAAGAATGSLTLDARGTPAAHALLAWDGVRIENLVRMADTRRVTGTVDGRVDLQAEGDSIAALAASTHGSASANLRQGSLARRLDAELGLDGARFVGSLFAGDRPIPVRCASIAFDVTAGVARARRLAIDTATTRIAGRGSIDLRDQRIDLSLTPQARDPGLLTLKRSIAVGGMLTAPKVHLVDRVATPAPAAARDDAAACAPA